MDRYNLVVIGSGPGGYVSAIKAAKLGMKTAIIESKEIGGTCLNRGCIPTKTLMHSSHLYYQAQALKDIGIHYEGLSLNMEELQAHKEGVIQKIRQGITSLLEANGVKIIRGTAIIDSGNRVSINITGTNSNNILRNKDDLKNHKEEQLNEGHVTEDLIHEELHEEINEEIIKDDKFVIESEKILIATGSKPVIPLIEGTDLPNVVTSDELLSRGTLYKKLLIIGGGVIGIEFSSIFSDLGCEVEMIEAMDRIVSNMDKEISQSIAMSLKKKGVVIHTKSKVSRILEGSETGELICEYEEKGQIKKAIADGVLLSVGRKANTAGLFAPELPIEFDGTNIRVTEDFKTSLPGVYAIGDVIRGKQLAHAASAQGIVAVEKMCGKEPGVDLSVIPSCIYTNPEVATVGCTEEEALASGYSVKIGKYPMLGNSKTLLSQGERGFIKVIIDSDTDKVLGAQLLCDRATDMVSEFATAIALGLTSKKLASIIRPHPTYSEAITEAVEDVEGMAIHLMPKRV